MALKQLKYQIINEGWRLSSGQREREGQKDSAVVTG